MAITASMVKELREMTGAGMMDCKKALAETDGDMNKAVDYLKEKGLAKAAKKAGRIAAEGIVATNVSEDGKVASIVEVNSETDFVAKNDTFKSYVANVAAQAATTNVATIEEFLDEAWALDTTKTVKEELASQIAVIGENMNIRRFAKVTTDGLVVSYIHAGGKIGVLVEADTDSSSDEVKECLKNVAMQVAALNPEYATRDDISADELDKIKTTTIESALNDPFSLPKPILDKLIAKAVNDKVWSDEDIAIYEEKKDNMKYLPNFLSEAAKPALAGLAVADKEEILANKIFGGLVEGRFAKQLKEICLLDQVYVKAEDGKQSVAQYVAGVAKATGAKINIKKYVRFETGEGLEKKEEDFAAEVAKQVAGN